MKINENMSAILTNKQLLRTENTLSASMERLSSGLKLNHSEDDPSGMAISNKMKAQIDALDQAGDNVDNAISAIQIADGALNEVSNILQRIRELSVQAANGTNSYNDKSTIQDEIDQLKQEVDRISEDTEYNEKDLLNGSSDVRYYSTPNAASRYKVSDEVPVGTYNFAVVGEATKGQWEFTIPAGGFKESGYVTINGVGIEVPENMSADDFYTQLLETATQAGCAISMETDSLTGDSNMSVFSNVYGSKGEVSLNISGKLAEEMGFDHAKSVTTTMTDNDWLLDVTTFSSGETIGINGYTLKVGGMNAEAAADEINKNVSHTGCIAQVVDGKLKITNEFDTSDEFIDLTLSKDTAVSLGFEKLIDSYDVVYAGKNAEVTFPINNAGKPDASLGGFSNTAQITSDGNRIFVKDINGFSMSFMLKNGFGGDVDIDGNVLTDPEELAIEVTDIGCMTIQLGGNQYQTMDIKIPEISSDTLYLDTVDVRVSGGADRALTMLDESIAYLNESRSRIGAYQNRLEYANSSLAESEENMTSAFSNLTDTDMAEEMTEYTQQSVLVQAAISVLSQANEMPQTVLSLLQR